MGGIFLGNIHVSTVLLLAISLSVLTIVTYFIVSVHCVVNTTCMYVCMYVHVCTCMYVCMYMYVHVHVHCLYV